MKVPVGLEIQEAVETDPRLGKALQWLVRWVAEHREISMASLDLECSLAAFGLDSGETLELSLDIDLEFGIQALFSDGWGDLSIRAAARRIAEAACEAN